jgi:peptidoglycan/LPS O-acetylase OafA/YrhL
MNNSSPVRLPQLDVLRFLAIFLVIGNHLPMCPPETNIVFYKIFEAWNLGGWIGVDLFFVLSGFLVSGLLFREYQKTQTIDFKQFLIRRGFKIYPPFWALIIITSLVTAFITRDFYRKGMLGEALFLQNYFSYFWEHTWSLAVEEHFYLLLCLVFFILLRFKKTPFNAIPNIFIFLAIACLAMRQATAIFGVYQYGTIIEPTHLRLDSLFFGVLISYLWHFRNLSENAYLIEYKTFIGIIGVICLLPAFFFKMSSHVWIGVFGVTFFYLGSGLLLLAFLKSDFSKNRFLPVLAAIGTYSYSIYLWNMPLQIWLDKFLKYEFGEYNWQIFAVTCFFGTFAVGIGMSKLVEYPMLKIRDRFFPAKNSAIINLPIS